MPDLGNNENSSWPMPKFKFQKASSMNITQKEIRKICQRLISIRTRQKRFKLYTNNNPLNKFRKPKNSSQLVYPPIIQANN